MSVVVVVELVAFVVVKLFVVPFPVVKLYEAAFVVVRLCEDVMKLEIVDVVGVAVVVNLVVVAMA